MDVNILLHGVELAALLFLAFRRPTQINQISVAPSQPPSVVVHTPAPPAPVTPTYSVPNLAEAPGLIQLLKRAVDGTWSHHSWRREGHPDIIEALATPGLAIARDGQIEEGQQ